MKRSTLKNRVASGIICLSLAAIGVFQSSNASPVVHDGNAPQMTGAPSQHLDKNEDLSSVEL